MESANGAGIPLDPRGQLHVIEGQLRHLGEPQTGLQEKLDDGTVARMVAASTQQCLILLLGQYTRLFVFGLGCDQFFREVLCQVA